LRRFRAFRFVFPIAMGNTLTMAWVMLEWIEQ
jgi:hypothetical protein